MRSRITFSLLVCAGALLLADPSHARGTDEPVFADLEGHAVHLSDRRGEIVLVNFWATWCAPCRHEMPVFVTLADELGPRGLTVLGISADGRNESAKVRKVLAELDVRFDVWVWANAYDLAHYGVGPGLPATLVVDGEGRVRHRLQGVVTTERLRPLLEPLLTKVTAVATPAVHGERR